MAYQSSWGCEAPSLSAGLLFLDSVPSTSQRLEARTHKGELGARVQTCPLLLRAGPSSGPPASNEGPPLLGGCQSPANILPIFTLVNPTQFSTAGSVILLPWGSLKPRSVPCPLRLSRARSPRDVIPLLMSQSNCPPLTNRTRRKNVPAPRPQAGGL